MKRILAMMMLAAVAMTMLSACTGAMYSTDPTLDTIDVPATDAPATEVPATEDPAPAGYFTYTDPYYCWSVQVPDIWNTYGQIIESDGEDAVRFMYKEAYEQVGAGHVFTIVSTTSPIDTSQLPAGGELYNDGTLQVYWWKATDVQFGGNYSSDTAEFQRQADEYGQLSETREEILKSFSF